MNAKILNSRKLSAVAGVMATINLSHGWAACSPIVIDMGMDGIQLGTAGVGVYFDVDADGVYEYIQWVKPGGDEVFLALDRNSNGTIDDGSELFGVGTPMIIEGGTAPNGFVGLAQYDGLALGGDDDGLISSKDAVWTELRIWHDRNADGTSAPSEVFYLDEILANRNLVELETIPKTRSYYDDAGNYIPFWALATENTRKGLVQTLMVDVFFRVIE